MYIFLQGELEYYKEMYRQVKSENEMLKSKVDKLVDEMESAKVCILLFRFIRDGLINCGVNLS